MFEKFREPTESNFTDKFSVGLRFRDRIAREFLAYNLNYSDVIPELKTRYDIDISEDRLEEYLGGYGSYPRNLDYYMADLFNLSLDSFPEGLFYKDYDETVKEHLIAKFLRTTDTFSNILKTYID